MAKNRSAPEGLVSFLDQETLTLTVNGALGRNPTYCEGTKPSKKEEFRKALRDCLQSRREEYQAERVGCERHIKNIETLSSTLSEPYKGILRGGEFRIGTAQKALNLYLKYCWARGVVKEPPHCPIDSIVLANAGNCAGSDKCEICREVPWTRIRCTREYLHFVDNAKAEATRCGLSLACWELKLWNANAAWDERKNDDPSLKWKPFRDCFMVKKDEGE